MKTPIVLLLVLSLIGAPYRISAIDSHNPDDGKKSIVPACLVLIVGGVIVYLIWKLCKKIPGPPPTTKPPPTNAPPAGTNTNHVGKSAWVLPRVQMPDKDLYLESEWDMMTVAFERSSDLQNWERCLFVTNWVGQSNVVCVAADANGPIATNMIPVMWPSGQAICDFGNLLALIPEGDKRYYRVVELAQ